MDAKELPFLPPKRGKIFIVPNGIRPVMQRTAIEVLNYLTEMKSNAFKRLLSLIFLLTERVKII